MASMRRGVPPPRRIGEPPVTSTRNMSRERARAARSASPAVAELRRVDNAKPDRKSHKPCRPNRRALMPVDLSRHSEISSHVSLRNFRFFAVLRGEIAFSAWFPCNLMRHPTCVSLVRGSTVSGRAFRFALSYSRSLFTSTQPETPIARRVLPTSRGARASVRHSRSLSLPRRTRAPGMSTQPGPANPMTCCPPSLREKPFNACRRSAR